VRRRNKKAGPAIERLSGLQSRADRQGVVEVFTRAFVNPSWMERHVHRALLQPPLFNPEHTRIAVADGRVVSAVVMGPRHVRFGAVKVPAMTVGPVGTHDSYRKRGFAAAAMNDASRYMKENGVLVAYLQGIDDFYYRFGYYPYMAPSRISFKRDGAKKEARPGRLRAMTLRDLPAVRKLYDEATAGRICAAARDETTWAWLMGPGRRTWLFRRPRLILDARGRLCGYVTTNWKEDPTFAEVIVRPDEARLRAALGAFVRFARGLERKELILPVPWDDPLATFLRQFVEAQYRASSGPTGGALLKIVDFPALMQRLEPLFAQRWRAAHSALPRTEFTLASEIGKVGLSVSKRAVRVGPPNARALAFIPQRWLSGMLTGYYALGEVAARQGARIPAGLVPVMDTLFPAGWPFVYQGDNY
jgi:predicted N-acetyltransferase YhbS